MDDEFAKDVSEFDTLEELKNSIKEKMQKTNEQRAEYETEEAAINAVCDNVEVEIPSGMIDSEVENMMKDVEQRLQYQGLTLQQYFMLSGKTEAQVKDEMKEQAEKAVKSRLVIEDIIKEEDIKPEEKEVEEKDDKKYDKEEIVGQSVKKGEVLTTGDEIILYIPKVLEKYPDFVNENWSITDIQKWAKEKEISLVIIEKETNEYKEGAIIAQSRAKDSVVVSGAELKITIAKKIETPEEVEPNPATPPEEQGTN